MLGKQNSCRTNPLHHQRRSHIKSVVFSPKHCPSLPPEQPIYSLFLILGMKTAPLGFFLLFRNPQGFSVSPEDPRPLQVLEVLLELHIPPQTPLMPNSSKFIKMSLCKVNLYLALCSFKK